MNPKQLTPTQSLATDISRNIAVTAGAGSGKTEVLTQRLVHIFEKNRHLGIRNVLVLTFTEKAAGEMKQRFRESLGHQVARPDLSEREKKYWAGLHEEFSENYISTIHAFCASVLRRYPIEADIDPTFSVLEGFEIQALLQESIKTVLHKKARDSQDKDLGVLLDIWRRSHLLNILYELVEKRWELREWIERYRTWEPDRLMSEVIGYRDACLAKLLTNKKLLNLHIKFNNYSPDSPDAKEDSFGRAKREYCNFLDALLKSPTLPPEQALGLIRRKRPRKPGKVTKAWSRDGFSLKESIDELTALLSRYPLEDFSRRREEEGIRILKSLATLLSECLEEYKNKKRENQCLDFEDLQIETASLISKHPKVCRDLATQFHYIMVDEFQDTNDLQWQIIRQISSDSNDRLMPNKLFIVGDEKQSIYSFRGGDVTTFGRARAELQKTQKKGADIVFHENFRSSIELIQFLNTFFNHLLSRPEGYEPYEATPQMLQPGREITGGSVELLLVNERDDSLASYREEARLIAGRISRIKAGCLSQYMDITQLLNSNEPAIAILFRRRTHLKIYEDALREAGLDFIVTGSQGFFQHQEIKDFSNILDFLTNPGNSISLAGVLRSPLVGISDDALFSLSRSEGNTLWEKTQNFAATESWEAADAAAFIRGKKFLFSCLMMRDRLSISELTRAILDESGYTAIMDADIRVNVEKLISMARKHQRIPWRGIRNFAAFLNEQIVLEEKEEGKYISDGAIQLLTIHRSKGLEFPLVIIPDLSGDFFKGRHPSYYLGKINHAIQLGIKMPDPDKNFKSDGIFYHKILSRQSRKKDIAELKRLLYVAATRAQNHLIFAGQVRPETKKTLDNCRNFMQWLQIILRIESLNSARIPEKNTTIPIICSLDEKSPDPVSSNLRQEIPQKTRGNISYNLAEVKKSGIIRLSPTALSCYASCPRCYYFRYILGVPGFSPYVESSNEDRTNEEQSLNAVFRGIVAHSLFEDEIFEDREILHRRVLSQMQQTTDVSIKSLCDEVYVNLKNYRDSATFQDASNEFYNEVPFEIEIGDIKLFGVIDKLYRSKTDGFLKVLDFKTNAVSNIYNASKEVEKHRYDLQVQCYCLAAERITGEKIKTAHLFFSHIPSKKREIIIPFDADAKRNLLSQLNSLAGNVNSGNYLFSPACKACSYNSFCHETEITKTIEKYRNNGIV